MNLDSILDLYFRDQFTAVVERLAEDWPASGLPTETYEWADACHLGMMSAYRLADVARGEGHASAAKELEIQGALWTARSFACSLHSHNLFTGSGNILTLAYQAHLEGNHALAVEIAELTTPLMARAAPPGVPVSTFTRVCAEQRGTLLCDAIRAGAITGTLDKAIAELHDALACCGDDPRAQVKVSGGLANMTWWNGDQAGGIAQTEAVLEAARAHHLDLFAGIAEANLRTMRAGKDDLRAYQVA